MFTSFLKVADYCPACGEELFHQRADDFPAYLDILLVGHTVVPFALLVETEYAPAMWLQLAAWVPITIGLSLGLLQPIKGAIIAMQWFGGMHGFARLRARRHQGIRHRDGVRNGARPDLPHDRRSVASLCGDLAKSRSSRALCGSDSPR